MTQIFHLRIACTIALAFSLASCDFNHLTGNAVGPVAGAAIGAGGAAMFGASKPEIALLGLGGAGIGYYVTTLRFASGGVVQAGGQVYGIGDYATIEIPTDKLFDTNTAELLPEADPILRSAVVVLNRYPKNNIIVSGNTSGFGPVKFEQKLSEDRARAVANFLWSHGIGDFQGNSINMRKLNYVGYGNYFPIANHIRAQSIRQNSRIQITAYPTNAQLGIDKKQKTFNNIGSLQESSLSSGRATADMSDIFCGDRLPEAPSSRRNDFKDAFDESPGRARSVPQRPSLKGDYDATGCNIATSDCQTVMGGNEVKQGGFTGYKDEFSG